MAEQSAYRIFDVRHAGRQILSPHMARITFTGEDVAAMTTFAPDQRIKLFFPRADGTLPAIPNRPDWYDIYRTVPPRERSPMRTYTIRYLRADRCEVDVDFVLHGDNGPASRWALNAEPGDPIQISAPNAKYSGEVGGYEWQPPAGVRHVLLLADETALPAAAGILEELAALDAPPQVDAFLEVPDEADRLELPSWDGLDLRWLVREGQAEKTHAYGDRMITAASQVELPRDVLSGSNGEALMEPDSDDLLWDRASSAPGKFYAWVAGETGAVSRIRSALVKERGIDRRLANLMGYWKLGRERE
ncbi:MAG TPA: siderophore-interacting protein [Mesorhizobium sp.]|uniref:siderophore-interacting protein n=1 Tax=Mesorhizobium sp. TaxID=1871066 RepID=UPI002DDD98FD|nr:siderophore-interacting protein [Mesorhizobium sp.]HEV2504018.1 siderophore-interacting protein [Mesorhizobium sp.]